MDGDITTGNGTALAPADEAWAAGIIASLETDGYAVIQVSAAALKAATSNPRAERALEIETRRLTRELVRDVRKALATQ